MGVLLAGLAISGVPGAPAATNDSRCADKTIDRTAPDPTGGDSTIVVIGFNQPTEGDDVIFGTNGADTINGLGGNDVICGFDGVDTITGGSGDDTVNAGLGNDKVHGDAGDDILNAEGDGGDLDGGLGNDSLNGGSSSDNLVGGAGDDTISAGDGADTLDGGDGNDTLNAEGGDDTVLGATGDDQLNGGDGNDDLQGGDGADQLNGGAGLDRLTAGAGEDKAFGGDGNDIVDGGDGPDEVNGEGGDDSIGGGDGDDALFGGDGNDVLTGGNGADALNGGGGVDLADYSAVLGAITVDLATNDVKGSAGADTVAGVENVNGTAFEDELTGDAGPNVLNGGAGDDTIDGGPGNDVENGGDGNDTFSQSGEVGNGADVMHGDGGATDTVDYTSRGNPVSVTNDGVANDGEANEGDNVMPDVEGSNVRPTLAPIQTTAPDLSAPALSNFRTSGSRFSPNGDGRLDAFTVSGRFSESTTWTFEILSGANAVYSDTGSGSSFAATWNGLNNDGRNVVSTTFRWRVTGKDAAGNSLASRTGTVTVDREHPVIRGLHVSRTRLSLGRKQRSTVRFSVNEAGRVTVKIKRGSFLRKFGPTKLDDPATVAVTWNGRSRRGKAVRAGRYVVEVGTRDLAGNLRIRRAHVTVTP